MSLAVEGVKLLRRHKKIEKEIAEMLELAIGLCALINENADRIEEGDPDMELLSEIRWDREQCQSFRYDIGKSIAVQLKRVRKIKERVKSSPIDPVLDLGLDLFEKTYVKFKGEMYRCVDWLKARQRGCGDDLVEVLEKRTWQMSWAAENWKRLLILIFSNQ